MAVQMVLGGFVCRKLMAIKHNHIVNGVREAAPAQPASGRPSIQDGARLKSYFEFFVPFFSASNSFLRISVTI